MSPKCLTSDFSESVSALSEKELIKKICACFAPQIDKAPFGPGDDCAVIAPSEFKGKIVSTCDAVILDTHFDENTDPHLAGKKAMNRNISDIASMGGVPKFVMTSAIIGSNVSLAWLEDFSRGMRDAAKKYGVKFIGGDVAKGGDGFFSMHVNLLGDSENPILRTGANAGDILYVTGPLGCSFESGKHLDFEPRVCEGLFLAGFAGIGACTDLSDGLASDLKNIIPANCIAELNAEKIPLANFAGNTLQKALSDGEDYELLFTAPVDSNIAQKFFEKFGTNIFEIGKIKTAPNPNTETAIFINENGKISELQNSGYSHFGKRI
jgi:thiamine-monophosphate kinase